MNRFSQIRPAWWTALMAGIFLVSLSFTFRFVREEMDGVNRLSATRRELTELQTRSQIRLDTLSQRLVDPVVDPESLLGEGSAKGELTYSEMKTKDLSGAFRHHEVTVTVQNLPTGELPVLIRKAENASPPWRITSMQLRTVGGRLDGELLLEALDKSPPEL